MEPIDIQEPPIGAMNRADRRARRAYGPLAWQFKLERDQSRHTPRLDGQLRRWQIEKQRRNVA